MFVNLETKEKIYKTGEHMCPMDGFVCFHNTELICGRLGKATLGGGNKAGLFQACSQIICQELHNRIIYVVDILQCFMCLHVQKETQALELL